LETIYALSSAAGRAGVAVIRVSGRQAGEAVRSLAGRLPEPRRAMLAVVLAGAIVTYGGVSLFVAFFVIVPMARSLFRAASIPRRLIPAAIVLGTSTFTMSALPGTPSIQSCCRIVATSLASHPNRRTQP
jgi:H+/gluconate symporter-like permease